MAWTDDLVTARANLATRLVEITDKPRPDYDVDGQKVTWTTYKRILIEGIERLTRIIDEQGGDGGPYSEEIQAYTEPPFGAVPGGGVGV